jgi:CheY-like chemotaxis protein
MRSNSLKRCHGPEVNMKLLIIDDAPEMLRAFRDILEAYGCEVYVAENGEEGLARYRSYAGCRSNGYIDAEA